MDYELFHDESQISGYWHGMLLVPTSTKSTLMKLLKESRANIKYEYPISLKKIQEKGKLYGLAYSWMTIATAALASRLKNDPPLIYLGKREIGRYTYSYLPRLIGAKFILFTERDSHELMLNYPDHASKIETTFRMGLKGGLHFLGNSEEPINIVRMHFDGHKHYKRNLDSGRIIGRLQGLREYCTVNNNSSSIDDRSSDHRIQDCQSYDDCQLLQLTDLLVGSFRTSLGQITNPIHIDLALPIFHLLKKMEHGYARMRNSRWRNSVCMSRCYLDTGNWIFETLDLNNREIFEQLDLI